MFEFGMLEMTIICLIVLVVFGAGKHPEIGGVVGKSITDFKRATEGKEAVEINPKIEDDAKRTDSF